MSFIKEHSKLLLSIFIPVAVAGLTVLLLFLLMPHKSTVVSTDTSKPSTTKGTDTSVSTTPEVTVAGLQLDTTKKYGDKYASGILPVGDNKYSTTSTSKGTVYLCHAPNSGEGGAGSRGPWFVNNN